MKVSVARAEAAMTLLEEHTFGEQWEELRSQCPWSTVFQSRGYVEAWYRCYQKISEPVLVYSKGRGDAITGLLALGIDRKTGSWHIAGAHQAEYQTWLAGDTLGDSFIDAALRCLRNDHGLSQLCFRFLPQGVPLAWMQGKHWRRLCSVESRSRPLMALDDPERLATLLKKRSLWIRYNRLKRKGVLRLAEIKTRSELATRLPEIETLYDLRTCSLHGLAPFHDDPCKREFHLTLMDVPDLLHVSVLLLDDRVIAAHIGVREHDALYNGILCHSPFEARNSPGRIFILLLAQALSASGFRYFDLTPGLDLWKEQLATHHDTVSQLMIHANPLRRAAAQPKSRLRARVVKVLRKLDLEPRHIYIWIRKNVTSRLSGRRRTVTYRLDIGSGPPLKLQENHACDRLEDLLAFVPDDAGVRQRFLKNAVAALARGCHIYTLVRNTRLIHYGWLDPAPNQAKGSAMIGGFESPAGVVLPASDVLAGLEQMCRDAAALANVNRVYATVDVADRTHRQALEWIGFRHSQESFGGLNQASGPPSV